MNKIKVYEYMLGISVLSLKSDKYDVDDYAWGKGCFNFSLFYSNPIIFGVMDEYINSKVATFHFSAYQWEWEELECLVERWYEKLGDFAERYKMKLELPVPEIVISQIQQLLESEVK